MTHAGETIDQKWPRAPGGGKPVPGLVLVFSAGRPRLGALPLGARPLTLGRGEIAGMTLDDACLSREHAEAAFLGGAFRFRDLGSRNGTAVDGALLVAPFAGAEARVLRTGDTLWLPTADLRPFVGAAVDTSGGLVIGPTLREAWNRIAALAGAGDVLHVTGETGAGKEEAARCFHAAGPRARGPFVPVNCATIPQALAERLLFGARRGAYSGADADVDGYIQQADGGTLFLDEIAELEAGVQAKLLRVVETREVLPLGATKARRVDVGICSATHGDLPARVEAGRFREDLYFRVGRPAVALPPLRDRREDIPWLVQAFLAPAGAEAHASLIEASLMRAWPGNVRELAMEIKEAARLAAEAGSASVEVSHLAARAGGEALAAPAPDDAAAPDRDALEAVLARHEGNVARSARDLGVHRNQLRRWIARYGIDAARFRRGGG
ncbi:MAG TPA: sigma 54-interacting transcriptional regulator [Haliangiales bacterium]|nr:sigma 54-interacting transcriptional regulator [Haliangiales bacterium]